MPTLVYGDDVFHVFIVDTLGAAQASKPGRGAAAAAAAEAAAHALSSEGDRERPRRRAEQRALHDAARNDWRICCAVASDSR